MAQAKDELQAQRKYQLPVHDVWGDATQIEILAHRLIRGYPGDASAAEQEMLTALIDSIAGLRKALQSRRRSASG